MLAKVRKKSAFDAFAAEIEKNVNENSETAVQALRVRRCAEKTLGEVLSRQARF
jgi:hypothetical protein